MSRVTRKPDFCLCENKGADQLRSNCEADQRLCFGYTDSTLSLLIKSEISSFYAASGTVHVGLCQTWLEIPKTGFLASRLKLYSNEDTPQPVLSHGLPFTDTLKSSLLFSSICYIYLFSLLKFDCLWPCVSSNSLQDDFN